MLIPIPSDITIGVITSLIAALLFTALGYLFSTFIDFYRFRTINRVVNNFFSFKNHQILIIHSGVIDNKKSYSFHPSCDTSAVRTVANLIEETGRKEEKNFKILDTIQAEKEYSQKLWDHDIIFIGGPMYNPTLIPILEALDKLSLFRYQLKYDKSVDKTILFDKARHQLLLPSKDVSDDPKISLDLEQYDFGLIVSIANPINIKSQVIILAGVHGIGTLGVAEFLKNSGNRALLCNRKQNGAIIEVVTVNYRNNSPNQITEVKIT